MICQLHFSNACLIAESFHMSIIFLFAFLLIGCFCTAWALIWSLQDVSHTISFDQLGNSFKVWSSSSCVLKFYVNSEIIFSRWELWSKAFDRALYFDAEVLLWRQRLYLFMSKMFCGCPMANYLMDSSIPSPPPKGKNITIRLWGF